MTAFRARARAVDMLGRQQIANLPTALSELFKNSHDAYATSARADFYRAADMLVVTDDGVGMDRETFEQSWLTIATESKLDQGSAPKPRGMKRRVQLGEKGIGRFAIGALGSQVLVVSKRESCPAVAALVNWKMFELPHIDLDAVPIGLIELDSGELSDTDLARLKEPLADAVARFRGMDRSKRWQGQVDEIEAALDAMPDDPYRTIPDLEPIGKSGTAFLISPVSEELPAEIEAPGPNEASLFVRTLHGFTDAWLGSPTTTDFTVDFVDHRPGGDVESLLLPDHFFKASDFGRADHHIEGEFDKDGHFSGTIRIFDEEPAELEVSCPPSLKPRCGPFSFQLGVVQGLPSESRLDPEGFGAMTKRLGQLGGLYVYMDGIRVQPYGRPDVDYLEIEERRSRGAGYYYFSYRRVFGALSLTSKQNPELHEKAGREGFTRGRAYSSFRTLLVNLLVELAARYFRSDAPESRVYEKGRERLVREDRLRKERDRRAAAGRRRLRSQLATALQYLQETDFQEQASRIVHALTSHLERAERLQPATRQVAEAKRALERLLEPLEFDEPEGFAATEQMRRDMTLVERGAADAEQSYVAPAFASVDELAARTEARLVAVEADERERREFVEGRLTAARRRVATAENEGRRALTTLSETVGSALQGVLAAFNSGLGDIAQPSAPDSAGWIQEQAEFERAVDALAAESGRALARVANMIQASELVFSSGAPAPTELAAAADAEIVELRAQADDQLELVQLGMALAVVDHEVWATVANIRSDVRKVGSWAKKNPQLVRLYEDLRRDFDHLDSYLTLLTPMQRRLRRAKTTIKGSDISRYLRELFWGRLKDVGVEINASRDFQAVKISGYASTFYPVFINLVDNSLYWIRQAGTEPTGSIELDARGETLVYRDSGPGIADEIAGRVFDFGFTTKPGGRGLGLAIASQVLDRAGWSIRLDDCQDGSQFLIQQRRNNR
ncbi:MAG: hypothetical protein F4126_09660 [Acidimicrobiaceae bacterium]|nr:hypothetical protein [Acidimicrobiaceae bacterium]MYH93973.1 hypothetical protein [Acidimicrobiaceae bacterium]